MSVSVKQLITTNLKQCHQINDRFTLNSETDCSLIDLLPDSHTVFPLILFIMWFPDSFLAKAVYCDFCRYCLATISRLNTDNLTPPCYHQQYTLLPHTPPESSLSCHLYLLTQETLRLRAADDDDDDGTGERQDSPLGTRGHCQTQLVGCDATADTHLPLPHRRQPSMLNRPILVYLFTQSTADEASRAADDELMMIMMMLTVLLPALPCSRNYSKRTF